MNIHSERFSLPAKCDSVLLKTRPLKPLSNRQDYRREMTFL